MNFLFWVIWGESFGVYNAAWAIGAALFIGIVRRRKYSKKVSP